MGVRVRVKLGVRLWLRVVQLASRFRPNPNSDQVAGSPVNPEPDSIK